MSDTTVTLSQTQLTQVINTLGTMFSNGTTKRSHMFKGLKLVYPNLYGADFVEAHKRFINSWFALVDNHGLYEVKDGKGVKIATFYNEADAREYIAFKVESLS